VNKKKTRKGRGKMRQSRRGVRGKTGGRIEAGMRRRRGNELEERGGRVEEGMRGRQEEGRRWE
jgi:hypothetical protein